MTQAKEMQEGRTAIRLRGVRVHNLKGLDLDIPLGRWTVICGRSGTGKSSLAIDTLFAEGQRRYIESLPAYARQFLPRFDRPDVDSIENLPPAVAVGQERYAKASTIVAAAAGLLPYWRLLFAHHSQTWCVNCQQPVQADSPASIAQRLERLPADSTVTVAFILENTQEPEELLPALREEGFIRIEAAGQLLRLDGSDLKIPSATQPIYVLVDRICIGQAAHARIAEALETAFSEGEGTLAVKIDDQWQRFSDRLICPTCQTEYPAPSEALFNPANPEAACPDCQGKGQTDGLCPTCQGKRLQPGALAHRIGGRDFADVLNMTVLEAATFLEQWSTGQPETSQPHIRSAADHLRSRLQYLVSVGLGYLNLDRSVSSLSVGETQRVALTTALGSSLSNTLFVLDEPTAGLHPDEIPGLIGAIRRLVGQGNTVVTVEHDLKAIFASDHVIELGPEPGETGGQIIYQGDIIHFTHCEESPTIQFRQNPKKWTPKPPAHPGIFQIEGARKNNLQDLTVKFPANCMCVVAGVSGAGKSSLVFDTLYPAVQQTLAGKTATGEFDQMWGAERFDEVVFIDAETLGRSNRANAATYIKIFDEIRRMFAETPEAKMRGLKLGDFSFNVPGGRCERCEGAGILTVDMQFLPDVRMTCPDCGGHRYMQNVLEVKLRGRNIAEVLQLTVTRAFHFFREVRKIQQKLFVLQTAGLGYLQLGQPLSTISNGEAQRLKLASMIGSGGKKRLLLFDEPTTGLHPMDVVDWIYCVRALVDLGHSLVIVTNDLQVLSAADHIIELGPGAGAEGGRIIGQGTPQQIAQLDTPCGIALRNFLDGISN